MREGLIERVQRIMNGDYSSDEEMKCLVREFESSVLYAGASNLIFWPADEFDHEPTAAQVVDRALSCRPIDSDGIHGTAA